VLLEALHGLNAPTVALQKQHMAFLEPLIVFVVYDLEASSTNPLHSGERVRTDGSVDSLSLLVWSVRSHQPLVPPASVPHDS